jgi:menaquinone-dependent protoporphyrinogen IX oxidase
MAGVLIAYTTTLGYTRCIALRVSAELARAGHRPILVHVDRDPDPADYDAVILGAPVRNSAFVASMTCYAQRHAESLRRRPSGLFSACPPQEHRDHVTRRALDRYLRDFQAATGWQPDVIASFAGGNPYPHIGLTPTNEPEAEEAATDWDAVAGFVEAFLHTLQRDRARAPLSSVRPASR